MRLMNPCIDSRSRTLSRWFVLALIALVVTACGDDPPKPQDLPCGGRCIGTEFCDSTTGLCISTGSDPVDDTTDLDVGPDAPDVPNDSDAGTVDAPDTEEDPFVDAEEDPGEQDQDADGPDVDEDVPDIPDVQDDPDGGGDPDLETDGDTDIPDRYDAEADIDVGPREICPLDHLETPDDNNIPFRATDLHDTAFVGTDATRATVDRLGTRCGALLAFESFGGDTQCVDAEDGDSSDPKDHLGPCECLHMTDLGACGMETTADIPGDPDWHTFRLLRGDRAWVRVIFGGDVAAEGQVLVKIAAPPRDNVSCTIDAHCTAGGCVAGVCRPIIGGSAGHWLDLDGDLKSETYELDLGFSVTAEGDSSVVGTYFLQVWAAGTIPIPDFPYEVIVQVTPDNRRCLHDNWDDDWPDYHLPCEAGDAGCSPGSEDICTKASCTFPNGDPPEVLYNICQWDRQDVFRYQLTGGPADRRITVTWDTSEDTNVGSATLWRTDGGSVPQCIGVVPKDSSSTNAANFTNLASGTYQLVVSNNIALKYRIGIAAHDGGGDPDPPAPCP